MLRSRELLCIPQTPRSAYDEALATDMHAVADLPGPVVANRGAHFFTVAPFEISSGPFWLKRGQNQLSRCNSALCNP